LAVLTLLLNLRFEPVCYIASLSFIIFLVLLWNKFDNILFLARTLFLGGIGYFPMVVKIVYGPDAFFSGLERTTQDFDIVLVMYVATSLALLGNEIGLYLGERGQKQTVPRHDTAYERSLWKTIFFCSIPIVLWASYEAAKSAGSSVLIAGYASEYQDLPMGNIIAIGIICLLAMWVMLQKYRFKYAWCIFISLASIFLGYSIFLRGQRQDVLTALLGITVCYALVKGKSYKITIKSFLTIVLMYIVFEMWGVARLVIATTGINLKHLFTIIIANATDASDAIKFGTVSPIATTFSNTVWLINSGNLDFAWGKSYWEFILRTPPEFLYPGRPTDYSWMFEDYGLLAGGGFFELAEAYMNLGLVGTLLIPATISFLLSKAFYNTLRKQTVFSYFLLFSFLGVFFRSTWYQTFGFYKAFCTVIVLYFIFWLVHEILVIWQNLMTTCVHSKVILSNERSEK